MRTGILLMAAAAVSLAAAPALAAPANPASSLSVSKSARAGAVGSRASALEGASSGLILGGIALVALIVVVVVIASKDNKAKSP